MATLLLIVIYIAFIDIGLPDSILGSSWPSMFIEFGVEKDYLSYVSLISAVLSIMTSFFSGKIIKKFGSYAVICVSVMLTASALLGIYFSKTALWFTLSCIPLGLGAGAIDVSLNAFVAKYYKSREMSWLHCFWGVGAAASTLIVSAFADTNWRNSFLTVSLIQFATAIILFASAPLWKKVTAQKDKLLEQLNIPADIETDSPEKAEDFSQNQNAPNIQPKSRNSYDSAAVGTKKSKLAKLFGNGVFFSCLSFFCYCSMENITGVWGNTFMTSAKGFSTADGALIVSLFYIGITFGRFLCGFLTAKISDQILIIGGILLSVAGALLLLLAFTPAVAYVSFALIGLGCASVYPCSMQLTPKRFGRDNSPEIIGYQSAFAGLGITTMSPLFGIIANATDFSIFPYVLIGFALLLLLTQYLVLSQVKKTSN